MTTAGRVTALFTEGESRPHAQLRLDTDDRQLALNIVRWLGGALD